MADPVLQWVSEARTAGRRYNIPPSVLLGLVSVESGGREGLTSSANAGGLTQFIPGTARSYNVNVAPGHAGSQLMGAAHYLSDLGYGKDPRLALASYNAGPGNPGAAGSYPEKVLAAAKRYTGLDTGASVPASSTDASPAAAGARDGKLLDDTKAGGALKALLWVALVGVGTVLFGLGARRTFGVGAPAGATA